MVIDIIYGSVNCSEVIGVSMRVDYGEIVISDMLNEINISDVRINISNP